MVKYLDLLFLALVLPIFLATGLPVAGWAVASGAWCAQRVFSEALERKAREAEAKGDLKSLAGLMTGSMIARGWLVAIAVFGFGLALGDDVGLSAAVLLIATFTISFAMTLAARPFRGETPQP